MKKKVVSLFLACVFLFACAVPAFAVAGFDESVLANAEDIKHTESKNSNQGWYTAESTSDIWLDSEKDVGGAQTRVKLKSYIVADRDRARNRFNLYLYLDRKGDTSITVENICLEIGNTKEYTYHYFVDVPRNNKSSKHEGSDGSQWTRDDFFVRLNEDSLAIMQDMIDNRDGYVKIWIKLDSSDKYIYLRELGQDEIDGMIHLYNLYKQAGGLNEENLKEINKNPVEYNSEHKTKKK